MTVKINFRILIILLTLAFSWSSAAYACSAINSEPVSFAYYVGKPVIYILYLLAWFAFGAAAAMSLWMASSVIRRKPLPLKFWHLKNWINDILVLPIIGFLGFILARVLNKELPLLFAIAYLLLCCVVGYYSYQKFLNNPKRAKKGGLFINFVILPGATVLNYLIIDVMTSDGGNCGWLL